MGSQVTIHDVAREAGVSITTVSHALSGRRHVAAQTISRVRDTALRMGYVPYASALSLSAGKTMMLGLAVPDISNQFFGQVAQGVETAADKSDYGVILCTTGAELHREQRYFNLLRSRSIDGLIFIAGAAHWDESFTTLARNYPIVVADERIPSLSDVPFVGSDNHAGGRLAADHLHDLGHRRVAVISGPDGLGSTVDRLAGFGERFPDALRLEGDFTERSGYLAGRTLAQREPRPTAIFAGNDLMAFGCIAALKESGLSVPGDVSVVGYDDVDAAQRFAPALTTVRQAAHAIGERAAKVLIGNLRRRKPKPPEHLALPVQLVVRDSSGPCAPDADDSGLR